MGTIRRGNAAEAAVPSALAARGCPVLVPFGDGLSYDLGVDLGSSRLLRVQCKTGWEIGARLAFNSRSTDHGRGARGYEGLADAFGVYWSRRDRVYLVPVERVPRSRVYLSLGPTRNNQRRGVRSAAEYELDRWSLDDLEQLTPCGTVAGGGQADAA